MAVVTISSKGWLGVARVVSRMGLSVRVVLVSGLLLVVFAGNFSAADSSAEEESVRICSTGSRMSATSGLGDAGRAGSQAEAQGGQGCDDGYSQGQTARRAQTFCGPRHHKRTAVLRRGPVPGGWLLWPFCLHGFAVLAVFAQRGRRDLLGLETCGFKMYLLFLTK